MPILLKMTYRDQQGNVLEQVGPSELYLPRVKSLRGLSTRVILDALEEELEEYNWSRWDDVNVEWVILSSSIN